MIVYFRCSGCSQRISCSPDMIGAEAECPACGAALEVPEAAPPTPPPGGPIPPAAAQPAAATAEPYAELLPVRFGAGKKRQQDDLDMTPMVDVTFLLLIFFMITAAFSLQKSFELPASDDTQPSTSPITLEDLEDDPKYVTVRIDDYNTFFVSGAAWESEQEAPSRPELLEKLRYARAGAGGVVPTHMIVMASEAAVVDRVVMALDSGSAVGMEDVKMITVAEGEY